MTSVARMYPVQVPVAASTKTLLNEIISQTDLFLVSLPLKTYDKVLVSLTSYFFLHVPELRYMESILRYYHDILFSL